MGTLKGFLDYLLDRQKVLKKTEDHLCALASKYESFFAEIARVREAELIQLRDALRTGQGVPPELREALQKATAEESRGFDDKLEGLRQELRQVEEQAETLRRESLDHETRVRRANVRLDHDEEELKARSARLVREIDSHNATIRELGRGFGFFWNLFRTRAIQAERARLEREQADLLARIDAVRRLWHGAEGTFTTREEKRKAEWIEYRTRSAQLASQIEHLAGSRERVVERGALEKVLYERSPALPEPSPSDPPCSRCGQRNPAASHFCRICAQRLVPDRPDLLGSLDEIAEVNRHHQRFAAGIRASQEIIGLVRGIKSGLQNFMQSVSDMCESERRYKLARLKIDVPATSVEYGRHLDALLARVEGTQASLHPVEFAREVHDMIEGTFTEGRIQTFFETMGQELSKQAGAQW
jgi:DNA repair exonuclease SbcCD ATPase subunit